MEDLAKADQALQQAAQVYQRMGRSRNKAHATLALAAVRYYNRWDVAAAVDLLAQAFTMHPAPETDDEFIVPYAIYQVEAAGIEGNFDEEKV